MKNNNIHIALTGNPNSGKSSLFNCLTGLSQKVGNFPGVTVDKSTGTSNFTFGKATIIDLPGTYSVYPRRLDEWVSYKTLIGPQANPMPHMVIIVADASNLKRNLLYCTQLIDLKIPVIVALTMMDLARKKGIKIDIPALETALGVPVVSVNPRKNKGIDELKKIVEQTAEGLYRAPAYDIIENKKFAPEAIQAVQKIYTQASDYTALHYLMNHQGLFEQHANEEAALSSIIVKYHFNKAKIQAEEVISRYNRINNIIKVSVTEPDPLKKTLFAEKLDKVLLHRTWGYIILLSVLFIMFQSVFWLASYPMDWIDAGTANVMNWLSNTLPQNWFTDLLINGIVAGLGGIVIFVPQIAILFGLISVLEDTGYMARISFLTDRLMRSVGLNGKSVMPMISGFACAIPAVMSTRNIENAKERLLTILVTPLVSCSARLPVYIILIGLVIPEQKVMGIFGLQGLVMFLLYMLGFLMAFLVAYVAKWFIKIKDRSYFMLELPLYRSPRLKNMLKTMWVKSRIFVVDAGKIIMLISILLWLLSSYGPSKKMEAAHTTYNTEISQPGADTTQAELNLAHAQLENSYIGTLGKWIEPTITPLGYDWKIGIALLTSFAAREVFVGTMATLYSVAADEENGPLKEKMSAARRKDGTPVYTLATGLSLMIFYVFAMQCMSTLAIVKRETKSWKWPLIQFTYMTVLAYILSFVVYQFFK